MSVVFLVLVTNSVITMNIFSVSFILLLFESSIVIGYSIPKIQHKQRSSQASEIEDSVTDVYEVREGDKQTVRIVHPRAEKPTLREIIYYHVIKTPYEYQKSEEDNRPNLMDISRPFTNSHGLPFISDEQKEEIIKEDKKEISSEDTTEEATIDEDVVSEADQSNEEDIEELEEESDTSTEKATQEPTTAEDNTAPTNRTDVLATTTATKELVESVVETTTAAPKTTIPDIEVTTNIEVEVTTARRDDVVEEKKNARNLLFSQAKNKYQNIVRKPVHARSKRETTIKKIPEAPRLPQLNYHALPEFVKKLISTPKPETLKRLKDHEEPEDFSEEDFKEELEHKIDEMIAKAMPDDDDDEEGDDDLDIGEEESIRRVRTYGMNLTMDRGYVWNDLWSKPGTFIDIGDLESVEDDDKKETTTDIPDHIDTAPVEYILHPSESRPIIEEENHDIENDRHEEANVDTEKHDNIDTTEHIHPSESKPIIEEKDHDIEDAKQEETNKDTEKHDNIDNVEHILHSSESRPIIEEENDIKDDKQQEANIDAEKHDNIDNHVNHYDLEDIEIPKILKSIPIDDEKDSDELQNEETLHKEPDTKKYPKENLAVDDKNEKPLESEAPKDISKQNAEEDKSNNDEEMIKKGKLPAEKADLFKDILNNEEFWKWFGDWTSAYLELMMKHIKRFVHDEVKRQIRAYETMKDTPVEGKKQSTDEKPKENVDHKGKPSHKKDNDKPKQEEFNHKTNEKNASKDNIDKKEQKITDNKIIIDGKEIPITHNTNFDIDDVKERENDLKHRKDREDNKATTPAANKEKPDEEKPKENLPVQISANNIFGNSVGNDKVTNVFIFYPSEDDDSYEIPDELKPVVNGSDNTFSFGKGEIDKRKEPEITGQKDEATMTEHTTTTNKPIEGVKEAQEKNDNGKVGNDDKKTPPKDTQSENIVSNTQENKEIETDNLNKEENIEKPIDKKKAQNTEENKNNHDSSSTEANNDNRIDNINKEESGRHEPEDGKKDNDKIDPKEGDKEKKDLKEEKHEAEGEKKEHNNIERKEEDIKTDNSKIELNKEDEKDSNNIDPKEEDAKDSSKIESKEEETKTESSNIDSIEENTKKEDSKLDSKKEDTKQENIKIDSKEEDTSNIALGETIDKEKPKEEDLKEEKHVSEAKDTEE